MEGRGEMALKVLARKARVLLLERCGHFLAPKMFVSNQHSVHLFHFISTKFISTPSLKYLKNISTMLSSLQAESFHQEKIGKKS